MITTSSATQVLSLADSWVSTVAANGKTERVSGDDIAPVRNANVTQSNEARLTAQLKDLDRLFVGLTQRAASCGDANQVGLLLGLALRCQRHGVQTALALRELQSKPRLPVVDLTDVE